MAWLDSPDIPFWTLAAVTWRGDPNVKRSMHTSPKVADNLINLPKRSQRVWRKWESLGLFVKYGMMTDDKFLEKANKFHIPKQAVKTNAIHWMNTVPPPKCYKNKEGKLVLLYSSNPGTNTFVKAAEAKGIESCWAEYHCWRCVSSTTWKWNGRMFRRGMQISPIIPIDKQDDLKSVLSEDEAKQIKRMVQHPAHRSAPECRSERTEHRCTTGDCHLSGNDAPHERDGTYERPMAALCKNARWSGING